jgi:hypothetical protein
MNECIWRYHKPLICARMVRLYTQLILALFSSHKGRRINRNKHYRSSRKNPLSVRTSYNSLHAVDTAPRSILTYCNFVENISYENVTTLMFSNINFKIKINSIQIRVAQQIGLGAITSDLNSSDSQFEPRREHKLL